MSLRDWPTDLRPAAPYGSGLKQPRQSPSKKARARIKRAYNQLNSDAHLALVTSLPCALCRCTKDIHPHHLRGGEAASHRAFGKRAPDKYCVPLCWEHHLGPEGVHASVPAGRDEPAWFLDGHYMDSEGLAVGLWAARGNLAAMSRMLTHHKLLASNRKLAAERGCR